MVTLEMLVGPFSPPWERMQSPPGHKTVPMGDKGLPESLIFSVTTFSKSAFWVPEGLSTSFRWHFPLPFVLFPLLIPLSLCFSFLCPYLFHYHILPRNSECTVVTAPLPSLCETCSFWATIAHLGWMTNRWERLASYPADVGPGRFLRVIDVQPSYHVVAKSPINTIFSPPYPFFLVPKQSPIKNRLKKQISMYTCEYKAHLWIRAPQTMYKGLVPGTDCPGGQWTEDRVPPPSLARFLKSWNWCLNRPLQRASLKGQSLSIWITFSIFPIFFFLHVQAFMELY